MKYTDKSTTVLSLITDKMRETPISERWSMAAIIDGFNDLAFAYREQTLEDRDQNQQSKDINISHISNLLFDAMSAIAVLYDIKASLDKYYSDKVQELK